jgi:hypothetical protein
LQQKDTLFTSHNIQCCILLMGVGIILIKFPFFAHGLHAFMSPSTSMFL